MHGRIPLPPAEDDEDLLRIDGTEQLLRYVFIDELYAKHLLQLDEDDAEDEDGVA